MNTLPVCGWLECLYSYVETATKNVCSWVALLIDHIEIEVMYIVYMAVSPEDSECVRTRK